MYVLRLEFKVDKVHADITPGSRLIILLL